MEMRPQTATIIRDRSRCETHPLRKSHARLRSQSRFRAFGARSVAIAHPEGDEADRLLSLSSHPGMANCVAGQRAQQCLESWLERSDVRQNVARGAEASSSGSVYATQEHRLHRRVAAVR